MGGFLDNTVDFDKLEYEPPRKEDHVDIERAIPGSSGSETMATHPAADDDKQAHPGGHSRSQEEAIQEELTKKESKAVFRLRLLVIAILLLTTVSVSLVVYFVTSRGESDGFQSQYEGAATKVIESFADIVYEMGAISGLGVASSAHSVDHKSDWPFVTLSNFHHRAGNARYLSGALMVSIAPLVRRDQFQEWDAFVDSTANNYWIDEGYAYQKELGMDDFEYEPNIERSALTGRKVDPMHYFDAEGWPHREVGTSERYLPVWQVSPLLKSRYVNQNMLRAINNATASLSEVAAVVLEKEAAFIGGFNLAPPGTIESPNPQTALFASLMSFSAEKKVPYLGDPMANIYIPVFDLFNQTERKAVAVMTSTIHWRKYFGKILPSNIKGIVVVLENSCEGAYTYEIHGDEAHVVGSGDQHDPLFDSSEWVGKFKTSTLEDGTVGGIKLHQEGCQYTIRVYPSQQFYDNYKTHMPVIITFSIVAVFLFTIGNFLIYDRLVERRQQVIMQTAVQSTVNVSLLEEKVKERTKKLEDSNKQLEEANQSIMHASARQLQHFACMSHEIRTPLNCIVGMSSLMKDTILDPRQAESMGMIVTSGELLLRIVDDVLDYSKLESGKVDIDVQKSNLQETLDAVVGSIESKAVSTNISFQTYYGNSVGEFLYTDNRRLQQILYNLLGNAVKFSVEGGTVELRLELCGGEPECKDCGDGRILRFIVKDYGKGIEEKDFEKIFLPFLQASTETERLYGGTGLGLAITAKLVKALGGSISVESEVGKWTKMNVDLPCGHHESIADIPELSLRLQKSSVLLVGAGAAEVSQLAGTFHQYHVAFSSYRDVKEFECAVQEKTVGDSNAYIVLVNENLYDNNALQRIARNVTKKVIFLAFGPQGCVKEARRHYHSFSRILPSVFIRTLGDCLEKEPCNPTQRIPVTSTATYSSLRVLIAEDNTINQRVLVRMLNRLGVDSVEVVANGKLAVDREANDQFDVILMDLQMPVMDGIEACTLIVDRQRRQEVKDGAKVVFATAHVMEAVKAKCHEAGGSGFLSKPFRIQDVDNCLQTVQASMGSSYI